MAETAKKPESKPEATVAAESETKPKKAKPRTVHEMMADDLAARQQLGIRVYGKPLEPHGNVDHLQMAYEEALDLAAYLKAEIVRRQELGYKPVSGV